MRRVVPCISAAAVAAALATTLAATLAPSLAAAIASAASAAEPPRVVASIKPVHALAAAVMEGIATPHLIVAGGGSPHSFALRPSDARALGNADIVLWIGPALETFLAPALSANSGNAAIIELGRADGLDPLALRESGGGGHDDHNDHGQNHDHDHDDGALDPHLWLDPQNALAMARAIASALTKADPQNRERYASNMRELERAIADLSAEIETRLAPARGRPYVVLHDGYQYFERAFALARPAAVTVSPEVSPGARRVSEIRDFVQSNAVACVFAEPQFSAPILATITEGTGAALGVLDPLGAGLEDGPELYPALMRDLAAAFADCLGAADETVSRSD